MIKGKVAPSKCLFYVVIQIKRETYSNKTLRKFNLVKNWHLLTAFNYITNA